MVDSAPNKKISPVLLILLVLVLVGFIGYVVYRLIVTDNTSVVLPDAPAPTSDPTPTATPSNPTPIISTTAITSSRLANKAFISKGEAIKSPNGNYVLKLTDAGDLEYSYKTVKTWNSGTSGGTRLVMQEDSNVVLYDAAGTPLWASGMVSGLTPVQKVSTNLVIRDTGIVSVVDSSNNDLKVLDIGLGITDKIFLAGKTLLGDNFPFGYFQLKSGDKCLNYNANNTFTLENCGDTTSQLFKYDKKQNLKPVFQGTNLSISPDPNTKSFGLDVSKNPSKFIYTVAGNILDVDQGKCLYQSGSSLAASECADKSPWTIFNRQTDIALGPNEVMKMGDEIAASSGAKLIFQKDGNIVLYNKSGKPVVSIEKKDPKSVLSMQGDGNLVLYSGSGQSLWASNTQKTDPKDHNQTYLKIVQSDSGESYLSLVFNGAEIRSFKSLGQ
jgi:hypothetical protein